MTIVFILLGALGGTLLLISKMGLDLPPSSADVLALETGNAQSREDLVVAA